MKNILLLTDFSNRSDHAADLASTIAERVQANILLYHITKTPVVLPSAEPVLLPEESYSIAEEESKAKLEMLANRLREKFRSNPDSLFHPDIYINSKKGSIADTIASVVKQENVWLIVMGTKGGNSGSNFLFGSKAVASIDKSHCPVLLVPENWQVKEIKKVAFATDLRVKNLEKVDFLVDFIKSLRSEAVVTYVSSEGFTSEEDYLNASRLSDRLNVVQSSFKGITGEDVVTKLAEFASEHKVDVLSVIHKRYNFLRKLFHNSTTKVLLSHSNVPLLVLPG